MYFSFSSGYRYRKFIDKGFSEVYQRNSNVGYEKGDYCMTGTVLGHFYKWWLLL